MFNHRTNLINPQFIVQFPYMLQQYSRFSETPLSAAFGPNNRNSPSRPNPLFQESYYEQSLRETEIVAYPRITDNASHIDYVTPTFQNHLNVSLNQSLDTNLTEHIQGNVYYGDLEQQTCYNLKGFENEPAEGHCCITLFNLLLFAMIIIFIVFMATLDLYPWIAGLFIGVPYLIYFFIGYCNNPKNEYFSNMKNYTQIKAIYQQVQNKRGHLKFKAECYHFTSGKYKRRIVTHMATETFSVRECIDASEPISNLKENNKYLFCRINNYYYFADQKSHNTFIKAFSTFKANNAKDKHQTYYHTLDVTLADASEFGLSVNGTGSCLKPMYYLCLVLGLGCFYLRYIECVSQQVSINVIKKLTI